MPYSRSVPQQLKGAVMPFHSYKCNKTVHGPHVECSCGGVATDWQALPREGTARRIHIVGLGDGTPSPFDDTWVVEYDPTRPGVGPDGRPLIAHLVVTKDQSQARQFSSVHEALTCWQQSHGLRTDGLPNRPLTAFTVEVL